MVRVKGLFLLVIAWGMWVSNCPLHAETALFSKTVKGSLVFRESTDGLPYLRVFLKLVNVGQSDLPWGGDTTQSIEAELLDASGNPVPQPPSASSIVSGGGLFLLPYGSRLEWLISHGGMSGGDLSGKSYIIEVGCKLWSVPKDSIDSYLLRIRFTGVPFARSEEEYTAGKAKLLLDLPPQKIVVSPSPG